MAHAILAASPTQDVSGGTSAITPTTGPSPGSSRRAPPSPGAGLPQPDCLDGFTKQARSEGFSVKVAEYLRHKWRPGSVKTYNAYWKTWTRWCNRRQTDPFKPPVTIVADYLVHLFEKGIATSSVGVARSAISSFACHYLGVPIGEDRRIRELMKAFRNIQPTRARYSATWSIDRLLEYWDTQPENSLLSLKLLTIKTAQLISISALTRADELNNMLVDNYSERDPGLAFRLLNPPKNHSEGPVPDIVLDEIPDALNLCPVICAREYIRKTAEFRARDDDMIRSRLFLSLDKRHFILCSAVHRGSYFIAKPKGSVHYVKDKQLNILRQSENNLPQIFRTKSIDQVWL